MKRNIAAVVLAAGSSSRMGQAKQLLRVGAMTLVRRIVEQAVASDAAITIVVLGAEAERVRDEVRSLPVALVENSKWAEGMGTSISAGVKAAKDCDAVVILACDQPHVSAAIINRLIAEHDATGKPIVAAGYSGTLGVPALFGREYFAELQRLAPDRGAKHLLQTKRREVEMVDFPDGAIDLDTLADYERFSGPQSSARDDAHLPPRRETRPTTG